MLLILAHRFRGVASQQWQLAEERVELGRHWARLPAPVDHLCHVRYALGKACGPSRNLRHRLLATLANKRDEASGIGVQSALHAVDSRASPNVRHRKEPQRQHARGAPLSWEQSFARRPQAAEEVK